MKRPNRVLTFFWVAAFGVLAFLILEAVGRTLSVAHVKRAWDLFFLGLTLSGFLLIPASIYIAAVGAMFSNYDRATPVTLVGGGTDGIFKVLMFALGYGITGSGAAAFGFSVSGLTALAFVVILAVGLINAVWLVDFCFGILDPVRVTDWIAGLVVRPVQIGPIGRPDASTINTVFSDLARLARGFAEGGRPSAATHAINRMTDVWGRSDGKIDLDARELAARVMGECAARKRDDMGAAISCFTAVTGIVIDDDSYRRKVHELHGDTVPPRQPHSGLLRMAVRWLWGD